MGLGWHGEADMVGATSFRPTDMRLMFVMDENGERRELNVATTATPEIEGDPEYMRRHFHKLLDTMRDQVEERGWM